jgi:predicted nucleotidyltransferase
MASDVEPITLGPLELRAGRLRPRPGLDIERWAVEEVRRLVLEAIGNREIDTYLIGSRARGDSRSLSDIDVALDGHGQPILMTLLVELRARLEESLIPFTVDVVDLAEASKAVRAAARREGVKWTS